ncbi:MAG: CRISPR system precrRNA processing endoribonuclease RAMP protein Cas6 [Sulfolobales archaeon]
MFRRSALGTGINSERRLPWPVGSGVLVRVNLGLKVIRDSILPPLSSKVVKHMIDSGALFSSLRALSSSRDQYKPIFISCLYGEDGRRLYKVGADDSVLHVRGGSRLFSRISAYVSKDDLSDIVGFSGGVINTPYGVFDVVVESVEVVGDLASLYLDLSGGLLLRFITPAVLSPKIMIPPVKRIMNRYSKIRVGTATLPIPGILFSYALRLWNRVAPESLRLSRPNDKDDIYSYRIAVMGTALTEIIGHRIRPVTVIIGRDSSGKIRKARGFTGYVEMNIHHKATRKAMERSLALANYLGLGRGRGIGLGEISVLPRKRGKAGLEETPS